MDQPALPLNYYCRSARLCLKKADFSRKAGLYADELQHLKKFESLILTTIPCHPNYHLNRGESHIAELQIILVDVEKRIRELESDLHGRSSPYSRRSTPSKVKPSKSTLRPKSTRLHAEQAKSPKKTRKTVKKTTKKRATWEDWATRLNEAHLCKSCGRTSPSASRKSPSQSRKSPERKSPSRSPRKSPQKSPRKSSPTGRKIWEAICGSCAGYAREHDTEGDNRWRFKSPDRAGKDRIGALSKKLLASNSRLHSRIRESSGSPISRALAPLEDDFINLQALVLELKGSLDGFKIRFDEEGRLWRGRTEGLEKEVQYLRHDTEVDLMAIKKSIQEEVKRTLDELTKDLAAAEDLWASSEAQKKEKLEHVMDESSAMMEDFKEKINFSFLETKATLMKSVDEKIGNSMGGIKAGLKNDFEILELGISRDVEDLRREMTSKCESFLTEVELAGMGGKQRVESLIKEALEKFLPQKLDTLVGKEKTVTEMKEALCLLWKEVEALSRKNGAEREKPRDQDGDYSRSKRGIESEDVRRGLIKQAVERLLPQKLDILSEGREKSISDVKEELRTLWTEVESLAKGRKEVFREGIADLGDVHESGQLKKQLQYVRKEAMQARLDAEDVRKDCDALKQYVGELEFKLLHLESMPQILESVEEAKSKMDMALSAIEKEKDLAMAAASDAASAASKAGEMVEDVIGSVSSEKINARRKSCEFQESLALEKDMVAESAGAVLLEVKRKSLVLQESLEQDICKVKDAFATEVRRMSNDMNQEKECAVAAASEVRNKTQEFQQRAKDAFAALEKERDAASTAASEISALAEKAEGLLAKLSRSKGDELRGGISCMETELDLKEKEGSFIKNLTILEAKVKETSAEQLILKDKVSEVSRKVRKLENMQVNVIRSVDELRSGTTGLEKSAAVLVPKFESAATILKEVEKRVGILENCTTGRRKKRGKESPLHESLGKGMDGPPIPVDAKLILLESRIDHVASATYTNLRILDTKVEKLSVGVQSALDGTTVTDNKCTSLGEEVVRVFRMLLCARKGNAGKPKENEKKTTTLSTRRRPQRFDGPTAEGKALAQPRCVCCNTGNRWTSPTEVHRNPRCPQHPDNRNREVRKINVRLGPESCAVSESPLQCTIHTSPTKQSQVVGMFLDSAAQVDEEEIQDPVEEGIEAEAGNARHTNVRLESGRIHVNVRHN